MDWKKEIKLSDLVRWKKTPAAAEAEAPSEPKKSRFARKPKESKEPKQPKAAKERKPKPERQPRAKRGAGIGRGKKLVGLKIGASHLAAARVVNSSGTRELVQVAHGRLEPGIVVGGELREPDALAEALKTFFRKHKLPRQGVRLGIASNRIGVRTFDVPGVDDQKQLHNAVRFRAQEALPIPLEEAVLDYHVLSDSVNEEGVRVRRVLLVVAYRELVDRYVAACRKAGIKLAGIDLEGFAALRALAGGAEAPTNAALVVASVGHDSSTLAVSNGSICEFTRVIEWGGQNLNVAIARALDLAPSEAEPIKHAVSLLEPAEAWTALTGEQAVKVRGAIQAELQVFARELISSLQFYQGQPGSLGIGEIILSGGTAQLPGIDAELGRVMGVRVRVGDPLGRVRRGKKIPADQQFGSLAVAIGLAIEEAA
ncbi:MAG: type IV pilus assembly protein PilM [Gaiellaceae bacterium]